LIVTFTDDILLPERRWDLTGFPNKNSHGQGLNFVFHKVLLYNVKKKHFVQRITVFLVSLFIILGPG